MITIRQAHREDISTIVAFQAAMAMETEGLELDTETATLGVTALFDDPEKGVYYIAEINNEVVGSLMITYEWSDWRNGTVWWIQSVFVKKEHRKSGVFATMYNHVKTIVEVSANLKGLRLYVEKDNLIAQQVYKNMGMDGTHYQLFEWLK